MGTSSHHGIILFDGVCNLCSGAVQFIIPRDPMGYFQFASLQSKTGQKLCRDFGLTSQALSTIVLIEKGHAYVKSAAVLRIARRLNRRWSWIYAFIFVPARVRDLIYDFVASRRYQWFGQKEACMMPDSDVRARFLDD